MKSVNIKLSLAENVKSFVNIVNRYPYDVDLRAGRHGQARRVGDMVGGGQLLDVAFAEDFNFFIAVRALHVAHG